MCLGTDIQREAMALQKGMTWEQLSRESGRSALGRGEGKVVGRGKPGEGARIKTDMNIRPRILSFLPPFLISAFSMLLTCKEENSRY